MDNIVLQSQKQKRTPNGNSKSFETQEKGFENTFSVDEYKIEDDKNNKDKKNKKGFVDTLFGTNSKSGMTNNVKKKGKATKVDVPKTAQETIPYKTVYPNGIIETETGRFTKSYKLDDVNFKIATQEEQENIFMDYGNLLNMFGPDVVAEITTFNRNIDKERFFEEVLIPMKGDELDSYRKENNKILQDKISQGRNNITHEKYLTLSIECDDIKSAINTFVRLDAEVSTYIKKINGSETNPMTLVERLSVLQEIYGDGSSLPLYSKAKIDGHAVKAFDLENIRKQGISTKDLIAPGAVKFSKDYFTLGDKFGRTLFIDNLPAFLSTDLLPELTELPCNMLSSIYFESIRQDKSVKLIRNQMININSNVVDAQKKATRSGYSTDLISPELIKAQDEASRLMTDLTSRNQKLFLVSMLITIFADDLEELNKQTKAAQTITSKFLCNLKKLQFQQEAGFNTSLPLANRKVFVQRLLTTESASVFIPFSAQELAQRNGMYYGLNAVSRNLILFNRINSKNASGLILGTPGSGKSFAAKREMINILLNTDDDVYVIDPEREYAPLAAMLNGEIVKIAAGSKTFINPLDMDIGYGDDNDPITLKSDFMGSLCETIVGGRYGLSPIQKSVIDRCVRNVYKEYLNHMGQLEKNITCDRDAMPTLVDFYEQLLVQPEPEAQNIALSLEIYCKGSLDTFSHRTNVNTNSRFIIYDIKDIGSGMKEMGLQVCLNDIWNKIIDNKKKGKRTWFYIDEFYLLTQTESSAAFLQEIFKRARKWDGIPTGITQNVEDMLVSKEVRTMISNCDFIMMLNQAPLDRSELSKMFSISSAQISYITNSDVGQGLLYTGKYIVPFVDEFPHDNSLYRAMTTKPDEVDLERYTI